MERSAFLHGIENPIDSQENIRRFMSQLRNYALNTSVRQLDSEQFAELEQVLTLSRYPQAEELVQRVKESAPSDDYLSRVATINSAMDSINALPIQEQLIAKRTLLAERGLCLETYAYRLGNPQSAAELRERKTFYLYALQNYLEAEAVMGNVITDYGLRIANCCSAVGILQAEVDMILNKLVGDNVRVERDDFPPQHPNYN